MRLSDILHYLEPPSQDLEDVLAASPQDDGDASSALAEGAEEVETNFEEPTEVECSADELAARSQAPIYILDHHDYWREATLEESIAATVQFQDPLLSERTQFGMGLRDGNGRLSEYTRQENDDRGISPAEIMSDIPVRVYPAEVILDSDSDSEMEAVPVTVRLPPKSSRRRRPAMSVPRAGPSVARPRKRKTREEPEGSSSSSGPSRPRRRSSISQDPALISIPEFDCELVSSNDSAGSTTAAESAPPRNFHPLNSGGSSPLKPKSVTTFAGYQCHMPGCYFSASSPQHIKHHYETFQHGRMHPRQVGAEE